MRNPLGRLGITRSVHSVCQSYKSHLFWNINIISVAPVFKLVQIEWYVFWCHIQSSIQIYCYSVLNIEMIVSFYLHFIPSSFSCLPVLCVPHSVLSLSFFRWLKRRANVKDERTKRLHCRRQIWYGCVGNGESCLQHWWILYWLK